MEYNFIHLHQVVSTNAYAHRLITANNANEGDVVLANYQTAGVGHGDNYWESEPGCNLLMSLIVEPVFLEASRQFVLTQIVSLALQDALSIYLDEHGIFIKWPNDIYVGDKKIGGVLIQNFIYGSNISYSIIGIGININQREFTSDAPNPISMSQLTNKKYSIDEVRDAILQRFSDLYSEISVSNNHVQIKKNYLSKLYRIGLLSEFEDKGGRFFGRIEDVDEFGRLAISRENGIISNYLLKEVRLVD